MILTPILVGLLAAAAVAYGAYQFMPVPDQVWRDRVTLALDETAIPNLPFWRALLQPVAKLVSRFAPAGWLFKTRTHLYWANRAGEWLGWSEAEIWALRLVGLIGGLAVSLTLFAASGPTMQLLPPAIGFIYPGVKLSGIAKKVERRFTRELPDVVQLLSLLVATGASLPEAMRRLGEGEGLAAGWLRDSLVAAAGKELFTPVVGLGQRQPEPGVLRARAIESGMLPLINLAVQLDLIHQKGAGAEALLNRLAEQVGEEYSAGVRKRAGELESKLTVPIMIFYFLPYIAALVLPMALPLIRGI